MKNSAPAQVVLGSRLLRVVALTSCLLALAALVALAGCSSGSSSGKLQVGAIAFVDANGAPIKTPGSLTAGQAVYVEVALTNDGGLLGADWTVSCGSKLPPGTPLPPGQVQDTSCGTFNPTHTLSGPVPKFATSANGYVAVFSAPVTPPSSGTITLYAAATADHSQYSSVSLVIQGQPISVGFSPAPPATVPVNGTTALTAVLSNDYTSAGANWTLTCGGSSCGSLSKTQSTTGVAVTYTAPATPPPGNDAIPAGQVSVTATSVADSSKSVSAAINILPVSVAVSPTMFSVPTNGTDNISATVSNDVTNRGVDWTVSCTNATTPGSCGSITPHTASGVTATYVAPSLAQIDAGTAIAVTATSTSDPTKSATSSLTTVRGLLVTGTVQAMRAPVRGATVSLYAAKPANSALDAMAGNPAAASVVTDESGSISIPYGYQCPEPDTQMYLISSGGNAGGGENPNLVLMTALGSCSDLDSSRFEVNEATTVAALYTLAGFMTNDLQIHAPSTASAALSTAFATASDLVDPSTGEARQQTRSGNGTVPQIRIHALARALSACAVTAGSTAGDGSPCDHLFRGVNPSVPPPLRPRNTAQAIWQLVRGTTGCSSSPQATNELFQLGSSSSVFEPTLSVPPADWTLPIKYDAAPKAASMPSLARTVLVNSPTRAAGSFVDSAGNVWVQGSGRKTTEFVGAASCADTLTTASSESDSQ